MSDSRLQDSRQSWDPARYARNARFVADLGAPVLELLAPRPGERILDLGSGDGALTEKLRDLGVDVLGVDASAEQVAAARARGLAAEVVDGEALAFGPEFDAVFSNAALHWMKRDPDAVIAGVRRALRPGGRFIAEMGGYMNVAAVRVALYAVLRQRGYDPVRADPWYFPSPDEYARRLARGGFVVDSIALIPRRTPLPGDIRDWLDTFAESFLAEAPASEHAGLKDDVADLVEPMLRDADGNWHTDYVRLRFAARLAET